MRNVLPATDWDMNDKPISKMHVKIMTCTYEGWTNPKEIFKLFPRDVKPVSIWLHEKGMDDRTSFDYRAVRDPVTMNTTVHWYVVFENKEDYMLYKLMESDLFNDIVEGWY